MTNDNKVEYFRKLVRCQAFKVIFIYVVILRPAWVTSDTISTSHYPSKKRKKVPYYLMVILSWPWLPIIPAPRRLREKEKSTASLGHLVRTCLHKTKTQIAHIVTNEREY